MSQTVNWDYFIMLTSADWVVPFFPLLGFNASNGEVEKLQSASRSTLKDLLGSGSDYYLSDFSDERRKRTNQIFIDELKSVGLSENLRNDVKEAANQFASKSMSSGLDWLFGQSADRLFGSANCCDGALEEAVCDECRKYWAASSDFFAYSSQIEKACLTSSSEWDRFLQKLTPGQPSALSDMLIELVESGSAVRLFWSLLGSRLIKEQIGQVQRLWIDETLKLGGHGSELGLPAWIGSSAANSS